MMKTLPNSVKNKITEIHEKCESINPEWGNIFEKCFTNTLMTTVKQLEDETTFVMTGDIPAMWLRDSTAQVKPYLKLAKEDKQMEILILGLLKRQFQYVLVDPYANAFNENASGNYYHLDETEHNPLVWERKYEVDSLCYPIQLAYLLWKETGTTEHFDEVFFKAVEKIINLWQIEQNHQKNSSYSFQRKTWRKEDTLINNGKGPIHAAIGMTWSGFRPSDDACVYSYLIPANMFAVVVLDYLKEIYKELEPNSNQQEKIVVLRNKIQIGIEKFGIVKSKENQLIYAYEVDGLGNYLVMDDANVPSLLSAPYLGYCKNNDPIYLATRKVILSEENFYYYKGKYAEGIGSSHTPEHYIWPIALSIQGLTAIDKNEKKTILETLVYCTGGTQLMHEGFDVNNPNNYTRDWFSWANMMFCELLLDYLD